jgi:hypothetical protein
MPSVDCLHYQLQSIWQDSTKGQETSWYETLRF